MADRVSDALRRLRERFGEAEAHVDATQARARKASARRLRTILAGDPTSWVAGLHDAALTPADRAELERILAEALPRGRMRVRPWLAGAGRRLLREARYRRRGLIGLISATAPALIIAGAMSAHTLKNAVPVRLTSPFAITWILRGGLTVRTSEIKDAEFVLSRRDGKSYLRRWFDGRGYGEVEVPDDFTQTALTLRQ